jgi:Domain of unknown function (DUF4349)
VNTGIEFLRQLEVDLLEAAERERGDRATSPAGTPARPRPGHRWVRVAGVAAAFLVIAGTIGTLVGDSAMETAFREVRDAVEGAGGGEGGVQASPAAPARTDEGRDAGDAGFIEGGQRYSFRHDEARGQLRDLSKIVRDGRIGVVVDDGRFGDTVGELTFIAERNGGFILSSSTQHERSGTFVLRIPARRFDRALAQIRGLGDVRFQQITGDDVTAEFIDLQARLRLLKARRALLSGLLREVTTTDEILRISSLVDDVQLRIEQLQGQIRFINDQVAEATLRVTITERTAPHTEPAEDIENPNLGSSVDLAVQGFLRIVGAVIVGLGYLIPLTILAGLIWLVVMLVRRRRAV